MAARQHGVIHRRQALEAGLSASAIQRRLASGSWCYELPKVYGFEASPRTWLRGCSAAALWAGRSAAIGYHAAAVLLGLDDRRPTVIDVVELRCLRAPNAVIRVHRPRSLEPQDVTEVAGIRVTSTSRTLLDLASVLEEEQVEVILDAALQRGMTSLPRLRWTLEREAAKGRKGTSVLRALVDSRTPFVVESQLETRFLQLLRRSRLPLPVSQHEVTDGTGLRSRLDFAYPAAKVGIELDGYRYHSGRAAWTSDARRANRLVQDGWRILRFTWSDVADRPTHVVAAIRELLLGEIRPA